MSGQPVELIKPPSPDAICAVILGVEAIHEVKWGDGWKSATVTIGSHVIIWQPQLAAAAAERLRSIADELDKEYGDQSRSTAPSPPATREVQ